MAEKENPKSKWLYRSLSPLRIRVFELEPGEYSEPVTGRLVHQAIDAEPYEAVSYVWGDWTKRRDIIVDGNTLSVTESLHTALRAFRHRRTGLATGTSPHGHVRRLWADAICINQEDLRERTSQVELMADIFAGAQRVLAWLGWEENRGTRFAMRFIQSFMGDPDGGVRLARILLLGDGVNPGPQSSLLSEGEQSLYNEQASKWDTVKTFFEIPYFHRTWIVQELGLAREANLYTAPKPECLPTGSTVTDHHAKLGNDDLVVELESINWKLLGQFVEYLDYNAASLVTHLGMLLWVPHHILMIWERKEDGTPDCDFLTALHWARILGVTDARDRVYSLLGHPLAVLDGELVIKPDYTVTRGVAYTKLAAAFIRKTHNLHVVNFVDHEIQPQAVERNWDRTDDAVMPSWVPDWHSINRTTPLPYPIAAADAADDAICIEGNIDGTDGSPLPQLLVRGWIVDEIAAVSRCMETKDFPLTNLTRELNKNTPFWLDRLWALVQPATTNGDAGEGVAALAILEDLSLALSLGSREEGEPASRVGGHQSLEEHRRSFSAYVIQYHSLWQEAQVLATATTRGSSASDNDEANPCYAASLYESLPASAQAELQRRAKDSTGTRFVECMTWPSMCRVVYRTISGQVGIGSRITCQGDLVCRVRGSPVLMNLRPNEIENGRNQVKRVGSEMAAGGPVLCTYIGPTVVPRYMKPELRDGRALRERAASFRIL